MTNSLLPSVFGTDAKTPPAFHSLHKEIDRVFNEFRDVFPSFNRDEPLDRHAQIVPRIDVSETDGAIEIAAELPGVEDDDIEVSVAGNVLTLKGEKSSNREESESDYKVVERSYGSFSRTLPFSFDIDPKKVTAKFDNGVLNITVEKPPEAAEKTQKIEISKAA